MITKTLFGYTRDNQPVSLYTVTNSTGACVEVMDYGCRVRRICVPDKDGVLQDVCLGYATLEEYERDDVYFGACIGRCTNLIANAQFFLGGKAYTLDKNNGAHHTHGGAKGFSQCVWEAAPTENTVVFSRSFAHLSDGYPGNLTMQVAYEWTDNNELCIRYEGVADQKTILNVTNHTYFNLNGAPYPSVFNHTLQIDADAVTEIRADLIPTGNYRDVAETPLDFRREKTIETDVHAPYDLLQFGRGYDHCFVLNGSGYRPVAVAYSPLTHIRLTCCTDQPGVQVYTTNDFSERHGKYGELLRKHSGLCLETQRFTNAVNLPQFPTVVLERGETFRSATTYRFDIVD